MRSHRPAKIPSPHGRRDCCTCMYVLAALSHNVFKIHKGMYVVVTAFEFSSHGRHQANIFRTFLYNRIPGTTTYCITIRRVKPVGEYHPRQNEYYVMHTAASKLPRTVCTLYPEWISAGSSHPPLGNNHRITYVPLSVNIICV